MEVRLKINTRVLAAVVGGALALVGSYYYSTRLEREAMAVLAEYLFDPGSAKVSNVFRGDPPSNAVCGHIQAKNRLGAYVGKRTFVIIPSAFGGRPDVRISSDSAAEPDTNWRTFCS